MNTRYSEIIYGYKGVLHILKLTLFLILFFNYEFIIALLQEKR